MRRQNRSGKPALRSTYHEVKAVVRIALGIIVLSSGLRMASVPRIPEPDAVVRLLELGASVLALVLVFVGTLALVLGGAVLESSGRRPVPNRCGPARL